MVRFELQFMYVIIFLYRTKEMSFNYSSLSREKSPFVMFFVGCLKKGQGYYARFRRI